MISVLAEEIEGDAKLQPSINGTLVQAGHRACRACSADNLEIGNIAPQDISKQIPAWSLLTSAYLFRDANHLTLTGRAISARK